MRNTDRIADVAATAIVAVVFVAVMAWFMALVPRAVDHEIEASNARIMAHMEMLRNGAGENP